MNELRIDVADLLTHAGARRPIRLAVPVADLGGSTARVEAPVEIDLLIERVPDGIVARGSIRATFVAECGICLRPIGAPLTVEVSELYEDHPIDGETYPIEGHVIDLEQLVRDAVLLDLPLAPTCVGVGDEACAPVAAAEALPSGETGPDDAPADPRWSALSQLEL